MRGEWFRLGCSLRSRPAQPAEGSSDFPLVELVETTLAWVCGFDSAARCARGWLNQRGTQPAGRGTRSVSATTRRVVGSSRSMPVSSWTRRMR